MKTKHDYIVDYLFEENGNFSQHEYDLIEAGVEFAQRWIDVEDELPQPDTKVFVEYEIIKDCTDFTALELSDNEVWHDNGSAFKYKVIKWRPITII